MIKNSKYLYCLSLFLLLILVITSTSLTTAQDKKSLTIATGAVGGSWYPIGGAIAELINPEIKEYGYSAGATPGGGIANPVAVSSGDAQLGLSQPTSLSLAVKGVINYNQPHEKLRSIANLFDMAYHFIVAENLNVDSIAEFVELDSVEFGPGNPGSSNAWIFELIMEAYGAPQEELDERGWSFEYAGHSDTASLYRDKHIDGFTMHTGIPSATGTEAMSARESKLLGIEQEKIDYLIDEYNMKQVKIPAGSYGGQNEDIDTVTMPVAFFTSIDVPEEVVYTITKTIYENTDYLADVHKALNQLDPEYGSKNLGIELHPGARKYYEEIGVL